MQAVWRAMFETGTEFLGTGSMFERLRRDPAVTFDPHVAHAGLIYDEASANLIKEAYLSYLRVAESADMPLFATTSTWRATGERIQRSNYRDQKINADNARFTKEVFANATVPVVIGGALGPSGDAYRPEEALGSDAARKFHAQQVEELSGAGVDFLVAFTLPAFSEAKGLALAMQESELPYLLSFVVRPGGTLLDGTSLTQAVQEIDAACQRPPLGYLVNCVHPTVFEQALEHSPSLPANRVIGLKANTSAKSAEELDGSDTLEVKYPALSSSLVICKMPYLY